MGNHRPLTFISAASGSKSVPRAVAAGLHHKDPLATARGTDFYSFIGRRYANLARSVLVLKNKSFRIVSADYRNRRLRYAPSMVHRNLSALCIQCYLLEHRFIPVPIRPIWNNQWNGQGSERRGG